MKRKVFDLEINKFIFKRALYNTLLGKILCGSDIIKNR